MTSPDRVNKAKITQSHKAKKGKLLTIGVIFGGRSFEHEVSLVSARSIINTLNRRKYKVILIGIAKNGYWLTGRKAKELLAGKEVGERGKFIPQFLKLIDVFFPVLHGSFGEDGTIQGFFETLDKPYVGAGVLSSSVGMDKIVQKIIWKQHKLPVVDFLWFLKKNWFRRDGPNVRVAKLKWDSILMHGKQKILKNIEEKIGYPCFVKPCNSGSSVGITKAHNRQGLIKSISLACKYDRKILVEMGIKKKFKEIEVSVLGNDEPRASLPGQIISSNEFYDYEAKYIDGKSLAIIPARLSRKLVKKIQDIAIRAYQAIDCSGMARVDFFLQDKKIYLNEINTIPGFTSISMYPKLWQASGLSYSKLLDKLIDLAIKRFNERKKLCYSYRPKREWYISRTSCENHK